MVARAGFGEEGRALVVLAFQRGVIELLDLSPSFRIHGGLHQATPCSVPDATRLWPSSNRASLCREILARPPRSLPRSAGRRIAARPHGFYVHPWPTALA